MNLWPAHILPQLQSCGKSQVLSRLFPHYLLAENCDMKADVNVGQLIMLTHYFHELFKWEGPVGCRGVKVVIECAIFKPFECHTGEVNGHHSKWIAAQERERERGGSSTFTHKDKTATHLYLG